MPLPLAMMIPFMGIQSAVMAKQFGENFQYGKRRISAMSNEEFNKLTPKLLNEKASAELKSMIPSMEESIIAMRDFQTFLIREFVKMVQDSLAGGLDEVAHSFGIQEHLFHPAGDQEITPPAPVTQPPVPPPVIGETPQPPVEVPQVIIPHHTGKRMSWPENVDRIKRPSVHAQGRLFPASPKGNFILQSNINGKWVTIKQSSSYNVLQPLAVKAWPLKDYFQFWIFATPQKTTRILYFMLDKHHR